MPALSKRKASAKKQPSITQHVLPLLKKPMEHIGKQIDVPGSYWEGRMSTDERSTSPVRLHPGVQDSSCLAHARLPLARMLSSRLPLVRSLSSRLARWLAALAH